MSIRIDVVFALFFLSLAGETVAQVAYSPGQLRQDLNKVDAKKWGADVAKLAENSARSIGASLDATGLNSAERQVAIEWFEKSSQVARMVDNYAATKSKIVDHLSKARNQYINKLAELAILEDAIHLGKVGDALAKELPQRRAQINTHVEELVHRAGEAEKRLTSDTEGRVKDRVSQLLNAGNLPGVVAKIPANILNNPERQKALIAELSVNAQRTVNETQKVGVALGSAAAMGINELQALSNNIISVENTLAKTPHVVMGQLEHSAKQTWDKAQKDMLKSLTDTLSLPNLGQFNNLPEQLRQQIKGLIEPFAPEKIQGELKGIFDQSPALASGGMMIAAAAFTEMQASRRHQEVMKELQKISAKLDEMDRKLDQIIEAQKETNQRLGKIEISLRELQLKQDAGFLAVLRELELIKSILLDGPLNEYCACRDLFGDREGKRFEKSDTPEKFALDRLAGITPHPACLVEKSVALKKHIQKCRQALFVAHETPSVLRRANWIKQANVQVADAQTQDISEQQLALAMLRDLGKAVDWIRLCNDDKKTPQAAISMPPQTLADAEKQADKLFAADPACISQGKKPMKAGFRQYFSDQGDLWPPLVLWHAYAAGNMVMYERAINSSTPQYLESAALGLERSIGLLDLLGRPESLQTGSVLLKAAEIAVAQRATLKSRLGNESCDAPDARSECLELKHTNEFLTLALGPADTEVAKFSPLYVGNLGAWLAWSKFREQGHSSKAEYIFAARLAASGCRACLASVIGPNWRLIHEDEDKHCQELINQQRAWLRVPENAEKLQRNPETGSLISEASEKGWCVSTGIVRGDAVNYYKKEAGQSEAIAMLPLPMASVLYRDELQRSPTADLITDTVAWLYRERLELAALMDKNSPVGMVLRLEHAATGPKPDNCLAESPRVVNVPPAQLRATSRFRRLNLSDAICSAK